MKKLLIILFLLPLFSEAQLGIQGRTVEQEYILDDYDLSALLYINTANIYDVEKKRKISNLVKTLKDNGLWTKTAILYLLNTGSEFSAKFNVKDPRDLNAAFRGTFSGGWTFDAIGAKANGVDTYINTYFNPTTSPTSNGLMSCGIYSELNIDEQKTSVGSNTNFSAQILNISPRSFNQHTVYGNATSPANKPLTNSKVWSFVSRETSASFYGKINAQTIVTTTAGIQAPNLNVYIGARNISWGAPDNFSANKFSVFWCGNVGLTDAESTILYNAIIAYR